MLSFATGQRRRNGQISRREWLRLGGFGLAGLTAGKMVGDAGLVSGADVGGFVPPGFGKAKSVILVFASGGQSQFETWDPKPEAPAEIRGEFAPISTSVPGTILCEHMPRIAQIADRLTIVRSMSHEDLDHGSAFYLSMTGHYHNRRSSNPPPQPTDFPTHGAVLKRVRASSPFVEPAVNLNGPALVPIIAGPGQFGGFLGHEYDPLVIGDVTGGPIVVPGLTPRQDLPQPRLTSRKKLLEVLDEQTGRLEYNLAMNDMGGLYDKAFEMLAKPATREAFNLAAESPELRDRYGRNRAAQACLLARRLVEAEVPLITVVFNHSNRGQDLKPDVPDEYGWDTHNDIFEAMKLHLLPRFDQAFSALIEDLEDRGLLEETLVICLGEFGRAPLVALEPRFAGATPGRKHWASVYSIALAGAGVARGGIVGKSDRAGAFPVAEKLGPWDVQATIFSALGIDPASHFTDSAGRPFPISTGRPIEALYAG